MEDNRINELFGDWFKDSEKKFIFMYLESDLNVFRFNVKLGKNDRYLYQIIENGKLVAKEVELQVKTGKCPELALRFYLIMIILAKEFDVLDIGRVQMVIDEGFKDEQELMIKREKEKMIEKIAEGEYNKKKEQKKKMQEKIEKE